MDNREKNDRCEEGGRVEDDRSDGMQFSSKDEGSQGAPDFLHNVYDTFWRCSKGESDENWFKELYEEKENIIPDKNQTTDLWSKICISIENI